MYLGSFQTFRESKGWKNGGESFCHHGFSRSGRTYHDEIMTAGCSYLQGAFYVFLAFYIGIIIVAMNLILVKFLTGIYYGWTRG